MDILAIANQKGGVGKTTTAVNLASALAHRRKKVLLIDLDAQGNATTASGLDKRELEYSIADVLLDDLPIHEAIVKTPNGFDIVGDNNELSGSDLHISQKHANHAILSKAMQQLADMPAKNGRAPKPYDFIVIDCAPSLSLLTINAMCATSGVIIPMQCEYFALEGLGKLLNTIKNVQKIHNQDLDIEGLLLTMYDSRLRLSNQVVEEVNSHFPEMVFETIISRNVRLSEAPSFGESILSYDAESKGAIQYIQLAEEVLLKNERLVKN